MIAFFRLLTNLFPLWSVLVAVVALIWPAVFSWYSSLFIQIGLGFIMLGMGLTLTLDDFKRVFLFPAALICGVTLQFVIMPLLGWIIVMFMNLPRDIAVGLILVSCCPGGTASNVVAFLSRANVALSVSMTSVSTIFALLLTPFLTKFYVGELVPVDPLGLLQSILFIVIFPVAAGLTINHFFNHIHRSFNNTLRFRRFLFLLLFLLTIFLFFRICNIRGVLIF